MRRVSGERGAAERHAARVRGARRPRWNPRGTADAVESVAEPRGTPRWGGRSWRGAEEVRAGETRRRSELERGAEEAGALGARARFGTVGEEWGRSGSGGRVMEPSGGVGLGGRGRKDYRAGAEEGGGHTERADSLMIPGSSI